MLIIILFQNEESSDLKLGFGDFESDYTCPGGNNLSVENKDINTTPQSRSMHTGTIASDLKSMIAGTKKVIILILYCN